jgi:AcrR family transcriptional regulator
MAGTQTTTQDQTPEAPDRGARRRARTRERLTAAALELVAEKGVAGLRINEITERADVGLGSFYNHFDSKDEIVEAVVEETITVLAETVVQRTADLEDAAEGVSVSARMFVKLTEWDPDLARLLVNLDRADVLFEEAVLPFAQAALDRGVESGRFVVRNAELELVGIVGSTLAVMNGILDGRLAPDSDTIHAETVLRGLGLDPEDAYEVSRRPLPDLGGILTSA